MVLALLAVVVGLALLVWSADRFVEGASTVARSYGVPPLVVGMVIVGFGTSAPELIVSSIAALQGTPGLALGNAYGSNIANIALILGVTALVSPIVVRSQTLRKELPMLVGATALAAWQLWDGSITRLEAVVLMLVFGALMGWTIWEGMRNESDPLAAEMEVELKAGEMSKRASFVWLFVGLTVLILSSRLLVWGAVSIARDAGVSDLIIGLTIVAVGTSLPELASSIIAARKGEHDIAFGNVLGSNLFNTLAVVGIAGVISPMEVGAEVFRRDIPVMAVLTLSLFVVGFGWRRQGRINRVEGAILVAVFVAYIGYLARGAL